MNPTKVFPEAVPDPETITAAKYKTKNTVLGDGREKNGESTGLWRHLTLQH